MENSRKRKLVRILIYHGIALIVMLLMFFTHKCPIYHVFNIPCPGCGITRAYLAAFRLDFTLAFRYHPLFFIVLPSILYGVHRNKFKKKLNNKVEAILFIVIIVLFLAVYVFRLLNDGF